MKKIISMLLCAVMIMSVCVITVAAEEEPLVITVANDLHLDLKSSGAATVAKKNSINEIYSHASSGGQLLYESIAIIEAFLLAAGNNESDYVILPGDLTHAGNEEESLYFAAMLKEFEETYNKDVFVVPGNHDLTKSTVAEFEEYYKDFGYGEALANDPLSASYTADLGNGYILLAIDSCKAGAGEHGMTDARIDWIEAQCKSAKAEGKKVVAMLHHNVLEHNLISSVLHKGSVISENTTRLAEVLADNGAKYVFAGHTHAQDIASYTSASGNTMYEALTGSLISYPCPYRVVSFGEKVEFKTEYVRSIDTTVLPSGIHEEALALAQSNFLKYAKNCTYIGNELLILSVLKASRIKSLLNTDDETINSVIEKAAEKIEEAAALPIYAKDAQEGEDSLEAMAENIGIAFVETEYTTFSGLLTAIYQANTEGDEAFAAHTDEMILLSRCLAVIINYAFSDVTEEEFALVLSYVVSRFNVNISQDIINTIAGSLGNLNGVELLITSVALPIIARYGKDQGVEDKNVTLPGYGSEAEEESFIDMILNFFRKIFDFFHMLLAMIA